MRVGSGKALDVEMLTVGGVHRTQGGPHRRGDADLTFDRSPDGLGGVALRSQYRFCF